MKGGDGSPGAPQAGSPNDSWTVLRLILWSADYLKEKGVDSGRLDAEHLLAHVVGVGRLQLYLDFERPLTASELDGFRPLLKRRAAREPLQYIIGRQPFRELDLEVEPGVLIPRPETEVLVGEVLAWLAARERTSDVSALDIGAGTGAICLSLAHEGPLTHVIAIEIEEAALEVARRNRDSAKLSSSVELRRGSLFEPLHDGEVFDVIVSNPPYVPEVDAASLEPEVRDWEPRDALFAGEDGLDVLRRIATGARPHLKAGGLLALEVGAGQPAAVAAMLADTGEYEEIRVLRDYAGKERFVFAHGA
jgi:release factor glutamine methyltransferase